MKKLSGKVEYGAVNCDGTVIVVTTAIVDIDGANRIDKEIKNVLNPSAQAPR